MSNYSAWNPSLVWQPVFCRSSGRCCSMALPYWAAHTCCRSSPSTCSPYTITTAEVKLHISKHALVVITQQKLFQSFNMNNILFCFFYTHEYNLESELSLCLGGRFSNLVSVCQVKKEKCGLFYTSRALPSVLACLHFWFNAAPSCSEKHPQVHIQ